MPELPEVETIKRELEPLLLNKTLSLPIIYNPNCIQQGKDEFSSIEDKTILSISRKGKYLILHLSSNYKLLFHLRMEGKLYVLSKTSFPKDHLSLFFPFQNDSHGLAFYDVRKFGICAFLKEEEPGPLSNVGPEPFEIKNSDYLYAKFHTSSKMAKELLLDQKIMSGLGNIYANEVLYASKISPFLKGNELTKENCSALLKNAVIILSEAIEHHGSTIRSYHPSTDSSGEFQSFLKVYSRQGEECPICHHIIEKRFVAQRGTEFCPYCQKTGITVAITGKIASGKSLATSYFKKEGFVTFSADECVHSLYGDAAFLKQTKDKFPFLFTPEFNKDKISELLINDKKFKKEYLGFLYRKVKDKINDFIIENNAKDKALEIPVLFDAHMQNLFSIIIGVETTKQKQHLLERGDNPNKAVFNKLNSYDRHRLECTYFLHTDGTKKELHNQVRELIAKLKK